MQFDRRAQFGEYAARLTRQLATRRNQIWSVEVIRLKGAEMYVLMVIDVHTRRPLSATLAAIVTRGATGITTRPVEIQKIATW
jgi:hypothetical protein